jgi:hypothetical protein
LRSIPSAMHGVLTHPRLSRSSGRHEDGIRAFGHATQTNRLSTLFPWRIPDAGSSNGIVTSAHQIKCSQDQVRRMVRARLKLLSDFRRNKTSAIEFLRRISKSLRTLRSKTIQNALEILTPDGEISREKVRQILSMMQDVGKKRGGRCESGFADRFLVSPRSTEGTQIAGAGQSSVIAC